MIVYTCENGEYLQLQESIRRNPSVKRNLYVNITNHCTCACTFCLRTMKDMAEESTLWLREEPSVQEIEAVLDTVDWSLIKEVVFCGFGEPTTRLEVLTKVMRYVKEQHPGMPTRLNTNGLSDLDYGRDTSKDFEGILDTVSISLNASNAERYLDLTRSRFGIKSFEAMLAFAQHCKAYVPNVVLTVVDQVESPEEIAKCRKICEDRGLTLRVRPYEDH